MCSSSENAIHESPLENYQQEIKKVSGKRRISPEVASNRRRDNTACRRCAALVHSEGRDGQGRGEAPVSRGTTTRGIFPLARNQPNEVDVVDDERSRPDGPSNGRNYNRRSLLSRVREKTVRESRCLPAHRCREDDNTKRANETKLPSHLEK